MLGLAILVALNLADECFRARADYATPTANPPAAIRLEQIVDQVLGKSLKPVAGRLVALTRAPADAKIPQLLLCS